MFMMIIEPQPSNRQVKSKSKNPIDGERGEGREKKRERNKQEREKKEMWGIGRGTFQFPPRLPTCPSDYIYVHNEDRLTVMKTV